MAIGFAAHAMVAGAVVPTPVVTGPIPGDVPGTSPAHNLQFFATHIVMSDYGYVEQEFFYEGTATRYSSPTGGAPNNTTTAVVASTGHPYKTRLLVRRPTDPAKFNGIAIVEWVNVTNGYDVEIHWQESMAYYIREGYAFIGVSVQNAGVSGQGSPLRGLKAWSPTRYGTLNVNDNGAVGGDLLGYDIFSQAGQAVRNVPSVLGGLPVERVIAKGESQSAQRLFVYFNAIHHLDPVFDGAMITHNNNSIRADIPTPPIIKLYSENEFRTSPTIQPDTSTVRTWTVAGSTHSEFYTMIARAPILLRDHGLQAFDTCATPARSRVPFFMVINAATDHLVKWIRTGVEPPSAPPPEYTGTPLSLARDEHGNGLGSIRLAEMEVPVARNAAVTCGLGGNHEMFETAKLNALYGSHGSYVSKVSHATNAAVKAGFLLPEDAEITKDKAAGSIIGFGLECGYLCIDEDAFPIHPSSNLLRDQTAALHFVGSDDLVETLEGVTRNIATGYTQGSGAKAKQSFAKAIAGLRNYIAQVQERQASGHVVTETSTLLIDQTNTLIKELEAL
ncbi:MAG: alpha/beta hydrolase domain-containing protein [Casimicrobiaceae bacterium]